MVNKFIGIGYLCADPKSQSFNSNNKCTFSIAINNTKTDVLYLNIEAWNNVANNCSKYLNKGSCVYVEGKVKCNNWEDKNGNKRTSFFVNADIVRFLPNGKNAEPSSPPNKKVEKNELPPNIPSIVDEIEPPF